MMIQPALGHIAVVAVAPVIIRPSNTYRKSAMAFYMYSVRFLSETRSDARQRLHDMHACQSTQAPVHPMINHSVLVTVRHRYRTRFLRRILLITNT
jgi:hypothetical protein